MSSPSADPPAHSHYFDSNPSSNHDERIVSVSLPDLVFDLRTDSGVFSRRHLDPGTKILLQEAPPLPESGNLLDLGCGAGPIALTMALRRPGCRIWAVDVNERARQLTAANARRLDLINVDVVAPDSVPGDLRFDVIWSNPPIKIGKAALHAMLTTWLGTLVDGGHAILVVHKNLGSDSLAAWLEKEQWRVQRLTSRQGYRLLRVERS